jgi:hypothetical protein
MVGASSVPDVSRSRVCQSSTDDHLDHQSGTDKHLDHQSSADDHGQGSMALRSMITGRLCQRVMALIKWKKGLMPDISQEVMGEVEAWLRRRGISIYTDFL